MAKQHHKAFTLIEVLVSVMIISTVIMALLKMYADNTHIFSTIKNKSKINQYATFFLANKEYGLEKEELTLYDLVQNFDVEDQLRRKLKDIKVNILYQELETIDLAEYDDSATKEENSEEESDTTKEVNSNIAFEVGKTVVKVKNTSVGYLRLHLQ